PGDSSRPAPIEPIFTARTRADFNDELNAAALEGIHTIESTLEAARRDTSFEGFCAPCNRRVPLQIAFRPDDTHAPNWRETLTCPLCGMNNRQRLIAALVRANLDSTQQRDVYFTEQITPIFRWASQTFQRHRLVGSEYLSPTE